jgi:co-chaperonin GroES (HSP10)
LKVTPVDQRVLVVPDRHKDELRGIKLPEGSEQAADTGIVARLGSQAPEWLEEGLRVAFAPYSGIRFVADGEKYFLLDPSEVLCTFLDSNA